MNIKAIIHSLIVTVLLSCNNSSNNMSNYWNEYKNDTLFSTFYYNMPIYDTFIKDINNTPYAKRIMKKRGSTVEPVLGTMLNFLNLKRVNTRGIKAANKHVMMSALAYNLKKLLKFNRPKLKTIEKALQKANLKVGELLLFIKRCYQTQSFAF